MGQEEDTKNQGWRVFHAGWERGTDEWWGVRKSGLKR